MGSVVTAALRVIVAAIVGGVLAAAVADHLGPAPPPEPPLFGFTEGVPQVPAVPPLITALDAAPIDVVARASWDDEPVPLQRLRRRHRPLSSSSFIVVHHSDFIDAPGPATLRDYHRGTAGFADIGYHVVVGVDGTVYEGRPLDRVGAHAGVAVEQARDIRKDPDEDSIGVVLDGSYEDQRPSPVQLAAASRVIRDLRVRFGIPGRQVIGHREVKLELVEKRHLTLKGEGTVCPGDAAFDLIPALRLFSAPGPN